MSTVDPNLSPVIVVPGGGSASLPDDPAAVLLDAGAPDTVVTLNSSGVGAARTYADVVGDGLDAWLAADPGNPASLRNGIGAMENVLTTRGDLVRGGVGGAAERFAASTANTFVGGDGTDVVSLTAAQARSALGLATVAPLTSSTGWTLRNGAGGATIASSSARLTVGTGVAISGWANIPLAAYPHSIVGRYPLFSIDAVARIKTWTGGDSSQVFAGFGLRLGSSAIDGFVLQGRGDGGASGVFGYAEVIGPAGTVGTTTVARATIAGGQWWQRVTLFNGIVRFYHGTGVGGAAPTTWTEIGTSSTLTGVTVANTAYLTCTLDGGSGSPDDVTVEWDSIAASVVGVSP